MNCLTPVIHVVDDDGALRAALARLLQAAGHKVALYGSAIQLIEAAPWNGPGCILLDLQMPEQDGFGLLDHLADLKSTLPIVFLTGHGDVETSVRAIKAGAEDFLLKPVTKETLLNALRRALLRYAQRQEQHTRLASLRALVTKLTPRERQVFALVVAGRRNKQVAFELGTSERTIKAHRHNIMEKLGVRSLPEAVSIAERIGILGAPDQQLTG